MLYAPQTEDDIFLLVQKDNLGCTLQDLSQKCRERASNKIENS